MAILRRLIIAAAFVGTASSVEGQTLKAGSDLQAAINAVQPGATLVLEAGARFVGNFELPKKSGIAPITIRSSATLPNRRITEVDAPLLSVLASGNTQSAITCTGSANWRLDGIALESNTGGFGAIIECQDVVNVTFDRLLIVAGVEGQKRAILGNGRQVTLTRSHIANIFGKGQDSQCFLAYEGAGPYTITDNFLECASENVMFGGADNSSDATTPADILVEGNHFSKRLAWKPAVPGQPSGKVIKNLFELKNAKRVTIRRNLFERNWTDGQPGWAIVFTPANQDGRASWTTVQNVLFEYNIVRDTERGVNIIGTGYQQPTTPGGNIAIRHNLFVTAANFLQFAGEVNGLAVEHNTIMNGGPLVFMYDGSVWPVGEPKTRPDGFAARGFVYRNNLGFGHNGGLICEIAAAAECVIPKFVPEAVWTHNVVAGESRTYPPVTLKPPVEEHRLQFTPEFGLIPTSLYKRAASDGSDLGATLDPPPVVDPCKADPLVILPASIRWPTRNTGTRSITFSTGSKPWASFSVDWASKTLQVSDSRGCQAEASK